MAAQILRCNVLPPDNGDPELGAKNYYRVALSDSSLPVSYIANIPTDRNGIPTVAHALVYVDASEEEVDVLVSDSRVVRDPTPIRDFKGRVFPRTEDRG